MSLNKEESDKHRGIVTEHMKFFSNNQTPLDRKGNEYKFLHYIIEDYNVLDKFCDSLLVNDSYKGDLVIESNKFNDIIGFKISSLIQKDNIRKLKIGNRSKPFSDRISKSIGEALENNKNLISLEIFLDVTNLSPLHLCKFLTNKESSLESISYLKIDKSLFEFFSTYLSKKSKLKTIRFYYEPLKFIDLMYEPSIQKETYHTLSDKIQNDSNIVNVDVIPLFENFELEINKNLTDDINELNETLKFSCEINKKEIEGDVNIEKTYQEENNKMAEIIEKLDLIKDKSKQNSIISIRSYLNRTIGELLNNALYELEINRERNQEDEELFSAKGSIKFVAKFLIENKK